MRSNHTFRKLGLCLLLLGGFAAIVFAYRAFQPRSSDAQLVGSGSADESTTTAPRRTEAQRGTAETTAARNALRQLQQEAAYVHEEWYEPDCKGVLTFVQPVSGGQDAAWLWYDTTTGRVSSRFTAAELLSALSSELDGFVPLSKTTYIPILNLTNGRSSYYVGKMGTPPKYVVRVSFSGQRCDPVPDVLTLYDINSGQIIQSEIKLGSGLQGALLPIN